MPIGAHVTLRGDRMWEFADRLLSISLPRIRDFRGLSPKQFDGKATRLGVRKDEEGKNVRISRRTGKDI